MQNRVVLQQLATIKEVYGLRIGITTSGANQNEIILAALDLKVRDRSIFDTFQVTYNIFEQRLSEIIHLINRPGLRLIIKEAMANGRVFRNPDFPYYDMNYSFCEYLAQKYNVGVDAIALRFVIDSLEPAIVLSGANDLTQLHQNMKAASFRLTTEEIEQLRDLRGNTTDYWNARKNLAWQ